MIKIMLVAGSDSKHLADFLQQRGTFIVDFMYSNLYDNSTELLNSVIRIDKLVYIYQDTKVQSDMNIRQDMQVLKNVLEHNKFFKADELIFLCDDSEDSKQAQEYFKVVMSDCAVEHYSISVLDSIGSFSSVYAKLIGVTQNTDFDNKYRKLYRRSRGDDARMAYYPTDDRSVALEPFDYSNLEVLDNRRKLMHSITEPEQLNDTESSVRKKYLDLNLGGIPVKDKKKQCNVFLVFGDDKAGKSYWALQIANSANMNERKVTLIDCSKHQRVSALSEKNELFFDNLTPIDLIHRREFEHSCICSFPYGDILTYAKEVNKYCTMVFDTLVFILPKKYVQEVASVFEEYHVITLAVVHPYAENAKDAYTTLIGDQKIFILSRTGYTDDILSADQLKIQYTDTQIIKPYDFKSFDNTWLYRKLV